LETQNVELRKKEQRLGAELVQRKTTQALLIRAFAYLGLPNPDLYGFRGPTGKELEQIRKLQSKLLWGGQISKLLNHDLFDKIYSAEVLEEYNATCAHQVTSPSEVEENVKVSKPDIADEDSSDDDNGGGLFGSDASEDESSDYEEPIVRLKTKATPSLKRKGVNSSTQLEKKPKLIPPKAKKSKKEVSSVPAHLVSPSTRPSRAARDRGIAKRIQGVETLDLAATIVKLGSVEVPIQSPRAKPRSSRASTRSPHETSSEAIDSPTKPGNLASVSVAASESASVSTDEVAVETGETMTSSAQSTSRGSTKRASTIAAGKRVTDAETKSSTSNTKKKGDDGYDCYWRDDAFDPALREVIQEYMGMYWKDTRSTLTTSKPLTGPLPICEYFQFLTEGGLQMRAAGVANALPHPITFHLEELIKRGTGSSEKAMTDSIQRFIAVFNRLRSPDSLRKALDSSHCLLLPSSAPTSWNDEEVHAWEKLREYGQSTRKNHGGNLRRDWRSFMASMSHLVRMKVLPPTVIMDPAIPIYPRNVMTWLPVGPDDQFATLLDALDESEPHRVWFAFNPDGHPFFTNLVAKFPMYKPVLLL